MHVPRKDKAIVTQLVNSAWAATSNAVVSTGLSLYMQQNTSKLFLEILVVLRGTTQATGPPPGSVAGHQRRQSDGYRDRAYDSYTILHH